jgi:hypothetical protein
VKARTLEEAAAKWTFLSLCEPEEGTPLLLVTDEAADFLLELIEQNEARAAKPRMSHIDPHNQRKTPPERGKD